MSTLSLACARRKEAFYFLLYSSCLMRASDTVDTLRASCCWLTERAQAKAGAASIVTTPSRFASSAAGGSGHGINCRPGGCGGPLSLGRCSQRYPRHRVYSPEALDQAYTDRKPGATWAATASKGSTAGDGSDYNYRERKENVGWRHGRGEKVAVPRRDDVSRGTRSGPPRYLLSERTVQPVEQKVGFQI